MRTLTLELTDEVYEEIMRAAQESHLPPSQIAAARISAFPARKSRPVLTPQERKAAMARLTRHAGAVRSGDPASADNERIDADLMREYADAHEDADKSYCSTNFPNSSLISE